MACTTQAPFRHIDGSLYLQIDGVSIGYALSVTFANFYMCYIENSVLNNSPDKPATYCQYVNHCYVVNRDEQHFLSIKESLEEASVLKFTYELSTNNAFNFLDVHIDCSSQPYTTSVYRKFTSTVSYLNACSEYPDRHKTGTVKELIHRAYKISSTWTLFHQAVQQLKQSLFNNGYSNSQFDSALNKYLQQIQTTDNTPIVEDGTTNRIYYRNKMSASDREDEKALKRIIKNNITCIAPERQASATHLL